MGSMWQPEEDQDPLSPDDFKRELFQALLTDEKTQEFYGFKKNGDGTFKISDIGRVKSLPEETKVVLREFYKEFGSGHSEKNREESVPIEPSVICKKEEPQKNIISSWLRGELDGLYKSIDKLKCGSKRLRCLGEE